MEFEFDKEIDAILRKARESEFAFANDPKFVHLDADEISAFAENALPEKSKTLYTKHFAECDRCRRILSNLIALNAEAGITLASLPVVETVSETPIPWYRKLFAMPNLAYTTGAFVLVFGGFLGVLVLQNLDNSNSSVSQINEPQSKQSGPSINQDSEFSAANTASNTMSTNAASANSMMSNTASIATNSTAANSASSNAATTTANRVYSSNSNAALRDDNVADEAELSRTAPVISATPPPMLKEKDEDKKEVERERSETADAVAAPPAPSAQAPSPKIAARKSVPDTATTSGLAQENKSPATATKQVGGRTFRRVNSAWVDSQYRENTLLRYISRGSNDYKKLDGGLKDIAENLDGIVIVVWKSKGYRIQ